MAGRTLLRRMRLNRMPRLRQHRPQQPRYFDTRRKPGKLLSNWNIIVPYEILGRTWAQVA